VRRDSWLLSAPLGAASLTFLLHTAVAQGHTAEIIAAHIRNQGYPCDSAKEAQYQPDLSMPHGQVWILQCENASYRVHLVPNLAARVERLN
jgi:hypothetical protein